jgi:hypothetical protein
MTKPGIYKHVKGGMYRVLFCARQSTNGPDEGKLVVVYMDLKHGGLHVRDEIQFHEKVLAPPALGFNPGVEVPRFTFCGTMGNEMSDANAAELYEGLHETFTGRKPAPDIIDPRDRESPHGGDE